VIKETKSKNPIYQPMKLVILSSLPPEELSASLLDSDRSKWSHWTQRQRQISAKIPIFQPIEPI